MKALTIKLTPVRVIALGFMATILLGSLLLMLPCSIRDGVSVRYIDMLYTSTSAVCVTGLVIVDTATTFTPFGQLIVAVLIHLGGLGLAVIGVGVILAIGGKVNLKERNIIRESMNLGTGSGAVRMIKSVFLTTVLFEAVGALLSYIVFSKDYPPLHAAGISIFHSIASFNNAGFDILGNMQSLMPYKDNVLLNLVTAVLVFFGGIGFLVIREMMTKKFRWKKFSMHAKVVLMMSGVLIVAGTLLIKLTENITWLGAFFHSVSTRTAGFATYSLSNFSNAGLLIVIALMFIGASSGSTGGGIKTGTFFVLLQGLKSAATNKSEKAFKYSLPSNAFRKASVIAIFAFSIVFVGTYLMLIIEKNISVIDALFEVTSAFGTVGLSTGITTGLSDGSKLLSILIMYIGRLGPLTIASMWYFGKGEHTSYPEGNISIG